MQKVENITEFIKVFCEKIWFWLIVSIFSLQALFSEKVFIWLGFEAQHRWSVGVIAVLSLSLSVQHICDWIKEYVHQRSIIKNIDYLTDSALEELKHIARKRKKTLKVKDGDNIEQKRIVNHFNLEIKDGYVTFPDFLWKELEERFPEETGKRSAVCNSNKKNWAKKIFCSQIAWWLVVILVMVINPGEKLSSYIPSDRYLWFMLIFTAFLAWLIFKASHNCKKISTEDIVYMGAIYSLGLFFCLSSPISNSYPEKDIQRLFDCLTALGPLIVGFVAAFFACAQWKVTEKQKNLALLDKRLEFWEELDSLTVAIQYCPTKDEIVNNSSLDPLLLKDRLLKTALKGTVLFGEEIGIMLNKAASIYLEKVNNSWKNEEYPQEECLKKHIEIIEEERQLWEKIGDAAFDKIRELET